MAHLRSVPGQSGRPGFCVSKSREWFKRQGLDFRAFAREGIDASALEATGDGLALILVQHARASEASRG